MRALGLRACFPGTSPGECPVAGYVTGLLGKVDKVMGALAGGRADRPGSGRGRGKCGVLWCFGVRARRLCPGNSVALTDFLVKLWSFAQTWTGVHLASLIRGARRHLPSFPGHCGARSRGRPMAWRALIGSEPGPGGTGVLVWRAKVACASSTSGVVSWQSEARRELTRGRSDDRGRLAPTRPGTRGAADRGASRVRPGRTGPTARSRTEGRGTRARRRPPTTCDSSCVRGDGTAR